MPSGTWSALVLLALLVGIAIFVAQLHLALRVARWIFSILNYQFWIFRLFILLIINFELSIARAKTDVVIFNQHFVLCLLVSGRISAEVAQSRRVAEVVRGHRGPPPKSLDSDENFKSEHTLFCPELRFVAIYALFLEIFGHKKCLG